VIIHVLAATIWTGLTASPIALPVVGALVIVVLLRGVRRGLVQSHRVVCPSSNCHDLWMKIL